MAEFVATQKLHVAGEHPVNEFHSVLVFGQELEQTAKHRVPVRVRHNARLR